MPAFCPPFSSDFLTLFFAILCLGLFFIGTILTILLFHKAQVCGWKLLALLPISIIFNFVGSVALFFAILFLTDTNDNAIASTYFRINGQIKLACVFKEKALACPQTKDDVLSMEPGFAKLLAGKNWDYKYYPETNEYTLIVRHDWFRGALFDPLLQKLGGSDIAELNHTCQGINANYVNPKIWEKYKTLRNFK